MTSLQPNANIASHLPLMAEKVPKHAAILCPGGRDSSGKIRYQTFSFHELNRISDQYAHGFSKLGLKKGHRVLLMVSPGIELVALTFALFKIGAVPILMDPGMGKKNLLKCIERTAPDAFIAVPLAQAVRRFYPKAFRTVKIFVTVGRRYFWGGVTLKQCLSDDNTPFPIVETQSDHLAAILFTSGSTGAPKGVCYEHGMFQAQVRELRDHFQIQPGEVDLPMLPIFALFNPALGMTTVIPEMNPSRPATVDPARIVQAILQSGVTNTFGSPVLWHRIGRYCRENKIQLPTIKRILMAGAPVPSSLIREILEIIPNGEIQTPYGATEALPVSSITGLQVLKETQEKTNCGSGTCVGIRMPEVEIRIIRISDEPIAEWGNELLIPPGEIGEIIVRGPVVTREYDKLPEPTALSKIRDGETFWHRMGDVGCFDDQGRLWFCGRKTQRIETKNGPLYTECCEPIFNRHPRVFRTALVGIGHRGEQIPVMVVEPCRGEMPKNEQQRSQFIQELRKCGATGKLTSGIELFLFHPAFPVDVRHNAKIHREQLAEWAAEQLTGDSAG